MNILDIAIAKKLAGGGGGSGTDNYNDLSNLPKINDTTLSGNKTSANLGLQSEINSDSKLASDLVDDSTSTNKFVTASDKETWNAKQNAIDNSHKLSSDLVDDADHTNKFVTSTEKQTWNAKQNAIDADHKLSSSLVSFSAAEAAALASGIDSTKVAQISTNQTNILYVLGKTGRNLYNPEDCVINTRLDSQGKEFYELGYQTSDYIPISNISTLVRNVDFSLMESLCEYDENKNFISRTPDSSGSSVSLNTNTKYVRTSLLTSRTNVLLCSAEDWDVSHEYTPYSGLPNTDLTVLETEDRAALADAVDNGDKNKLDFATLSNPTLNNATVTKTDSSIVVTSSGAYARAVYSFDLKAGIYKLRLSASDITNASGSDTGMFVGLYKSSTITSNNELCRIYCTTAGDKYVEFNHAGGTVYVAFYINTSSTSYINSYTISQMMICTEADWKISQNYVPYRPSYDLVGTLFPTTYTAPVVNSDISSKLSILSGGYAKAGNLVTVNIRLSVTDTISAGSALFTGLPEPKTTAALSYGTAVVPVTNMCVNAQVSPNVMLIDTQGTIRLAGTPVSSDITTGIYILSATYLSA